MTLEYLALWALLTFAKESQCADCHPTIAAAYARHGMAAALQPLDEASLPPLLGATLLDPGSGYHYSIEPGSSGIELVERRPGARGFADHELRRTLRGFIGAGRFDRSLVLEHNARWFFAPVEWSTTQGLVLAPHQELSWHSRLWFPVTGECLSCHSDVAPRADYPLHLADGLPRQGIGCAGCHGPVDRHVASGGERGTLVKLGALPVERQLDICARCHLQGDARIELLPESAAPFQPGEDLFARRAAFVPRRPGDEFGFVSQSDRLALSACFTRSPAGMTCTTCHDAHHGTADTRPADYDRACLSCHASDACAREAPQAPLPERGCASCHMRRSFPFDLRHVQITDHFIRRTIPPPHEPATIRVHAAPDGDLVRFRWPAARGRTTDDEAAIDAGALAMAQVHLGHPQDALQNFARVGQAAPALLADLPLYHFMRARALEAGGQAGAAETAYRQALRLDPHQPEAAINLGLLLATRGAAEARDVLLKVAQDHPRAEQPWQNLVALEYRRKDARGMEQALEAAVQRNPDLARLWLQLGALRMQRRAIAPARDALLRAGEIDADLPRLWSRLGICLFELGDRDAARDAFQEALRRDPTDADARLGMQRSGG